MVACKESTGFLSAKVKRAGKGLRFDFERAGTSPVKVNIYRQSNGRKALSAKKVASFEVTESFTWNGKPKKGKLRKGDYYAQMSVVSPSGQIDMRNFTLRRTGSKFKTGKPFTKTDSCDLLSLYRLGGPVFGGRTPLRIAFVLTQPAKVTVTLLKGKKKVKRIKRNVKSANRAQRINIKAAQAAPWQLPRAAVGARPRAAQADRDAVRQEAVGRANLHRGTTTAGRNFGPPSSFHSTMRAPMRSLCLALACAGTLAAPVAAGAAADPPQPPIDRAVLKSLYNPVGFFKPGDSIPMPNTPPAPTGPGGIYNPSGHWSAYDSNLFESLNFPGRQAGDTTNNDPPGTNDPLGRFGYCAPEPAFMPQGKCANHALEYLDYYEATMKEILKDFGGTVHRYPFFNQGSETGTGTGAAGRPVEPLGGHLQHRRHRSRCRPPRRRRSSSPATGTSRTPRRPRRGTPPRATPRSSGSPRS